MRLRSRIVDALKLRLAACLPEATASVWGEVAPVVAIEQLTIKSTGGIERDGGNDFSLTATFTGFARVELHGAAIDALVLEPLLSDLAERNLFLPFEAVDPDQLTEKARLVLTELRDTVREAQVVSALRFSLTGALARRVSGQPRPELLVSRAPNVGADHLGDYRPVSEGLE